MSDDEADPELLALLRQSLGLGANSSTAPPTTGVLKSAEYVYDNSIDVAITLSGTKNAADTIWRLAQERSYSTQTWSEHELHPKSKDEATVNFIFTMNLLNFSFWSELGPEDRFQVEYRGQRWTGYWSLVAALQRALDDGYPITDPHFWVDQEQFSDDVAAYVFRSSTAETMPMFVERVAILREAGAVLYHSFSCRPLNIIQQADNSAAVLVNLLVDYFPNFRDSCSFHGREVKLHKRAQILVADLWACFNGSSYGYFTDIGSLTMFADYRIPQMLQSLGVLWYSPRLESRIARLQPMQAGEDQEVEIRGCSIWAVELVRREIDRRWPEGKGRLNAVLIDYLLYDTCKEREKAGDEDQMLPHHRVRSIFY